MNSQSDRTKFLGVATTTEFLAALAISVLVGLLTNLLVGAVVTVTLLALCAWVFSARRPWWGIPPAEVDELVARRSAMTDAERSAARRKLWMYGIGFVAACAAVGLLWGFTQS